MREYCLDWGHKYRKWKHRWGAGVGMGVRTPHRHLAGGVVGKVVHCERGINLRGRIEQGKYHHMQHISAKSSVPPTNSTNQSGVAVKMSGPGRKRDQRTVLSVQPTKMQQESSSAGAVVQACSKCIYAGTHVKSVTRRCHPVPKACR